MRRVTLSNEAEEILKRLKRQFTNAFLDDAVIFFIKNEEGREKLKRWSKDADDPKMGNSSFKGILDEWDK